MSEVVHFPAPPLRLLKPGPAPSAPVRSPEELRLLAMVHHATAGNAVALQAMTSLAFGGYVVERDAAEVAESYALALVEAIDLLGAPERLRPVRNAVHAWLVATDGGPGHVA